MMSLQESDQSMVHERCYLSYNWTRLRRRNICIHKYEINRYVIYGDSTR